MVNPPTAVEGSSVGALASWANGLDGWIRLVASQVLARRTALDDEIIDAAYYQMFAEKGLSGEARASVPMIQITEAPSDDAPTLGLVRIGETFHVNRLVDGQEISFNDRITVVYGEPASGKTGYARVLKQAAGARSASRVLPDVYTSSPGTPTATIEYSLGSDKATVAWREGSPALPALGRVCVFDAPAAPLHVDDDLQYLYTPADIALFEYVHAALSKVRDLLTAERGRRAPKGNPFLSRFRRGTPQFALVESLRASTDLDELRRLADVAEDEDALVANLTDHVRNLESGGQKVQLAGARATQTMCASAVAVADRLLEFDREKYASALGTWRHVASGCAMCAKHCFLATISLLDDPITSLDARRVDEVAERIVNLSNDHQGGSTTCGGRGLSAWRRPPKLIDSGLTKPATYGFQTVAFSVRADRFVYRSVEADCSTVPART
jgi:hypothetical protein